MITLTYTDLALFLYLLGVFLTVMGSLALSSKDKLIAVIIGVLWPFLLVAHWVYCTVKDCNNQ